MNDNKKLRTYNKIIQAYHQLATDEEKDMFVNNLYKQIEIMDKKFEEKMNRLENLSNWQDDEDIMSYLTNMSIIFGAIGTITGCMLDNITNSGVLQTILYASLGFGLPLSLTHIAQDLTDKSADNDAAKLAIYKVALEECLAEKIGYKIVRNDENDDQITM